MCVCVIVYVEHLAYFCYILFHLLRIPKKNEKGDEDPNQPIYVGEFPQVVRDAQAELMHKRVPGNCLGLSNSLIVCYYLTCDNIFVFSGR